MLDSHNSITWLDFWEKYMLNFGNLFVLAYYPKTEEGPLEEKQEGEYPTEKPD